ncbi:MAG: V-type ATPase 116kDa subunit family protein [Candidatus Micrarchaeota archaeon]
MAKVRITCPSSDLEFIVKQLYGYGMIEIRKSKQLSDGKPLASFSSVSSVLIELRAIEKEYGLKETVEGSENVSLTKLFKELDSLGFDFFHEQKNKLVSLRSKKGYLKDKLDELSEFKSIDFVIPLSNWIEVVCVRLNPRRKLSLRNASIHFFENKALVAFDKREKEKIFVQLHKVVLGFIDLPKVETTFAKEFVKTREELNGIEQEIAETSEKISSFVSKNKEELVFLRKSFEFKSSEGELPLNFGVSQSLCAVEGWVLDSDYYSLQKHFEDSFQGKVLVEKLHSKDVAPSEFNNPTLAKPFEAFMSFLSVPKFNELDPTILVALTFPLFFGMILGDIGYGLILLLLGVFLRVKASNLFLRNAGGMILYSGIFTVIFGFVFGEFFGFEDIFGVHLLPLIHRVNSHGVQELLALTVLVGFIHLALGYTLGIVNNVLHKHYKHALAKFGWLLIELSLVSLVALNIDIVFFEALKPFALFIGNDFALYGTILGVALLAYTEGVIAIMEIPGLFSNLLSYMRIAALGLAGVIIAGLVNQLKPDVNALLSFEPVAVIMFILMLVFFVVGHFVSLLLGVFESGIQALRLHAVEFFSKFYQGGATLFSPLKRK